MPDHVNKALHTIFDRYTTYLNAFGPEENYLRKKVESELGTKMIHLKMRCSGLGSEWGKVSYIFYSLPPIYLIILILKCYYQWFMAARGGKLLKHFGSVTDTGCCQVELWCQILFFLKSLVFLTVRDHHNLLEYNIPT